ncbi:hypothetical protein [Capnocytophaga sputigena]|jgi:hypothetical protein|uniref:hypothetical protein n=1 Tax=Capnocytophaga sputigena TaxID=1019 RepID=UPI001F3E4AE7|nr:hypothetical protein [Capnocytophaga sputigena]
MILNKIDQKAYYIPFVFTIVLIVISLLYLNAIFTNRLQNTIYIDLMFLLVGILAFCLLTIFMVGAIALPLSIRNIKNFIQKRINLFLQSKNEKELYRNNKQELINLPNQKNIFINKENTEKTLLNNTIPANTLSPDSIPINTASSDIINDNIIRKAQNKKRKFDIAKEYITETFSPYCSNEEIENICAAIIDYSKGETDFSKYPSIEIKVLNNLDLYHFAWSIWNHFRVGKQDVIVKLLKVIFATKLSDVDVKTIKSHLKDDENKGIVKIKEDLSNPDEQKK